MKILGLQKKTEPMQKTLFLFSPARVFRYRDPHYYTISRFCWEDIEIVEMDVNPENEFTRETVVPNFCCWFVIWIEN